LKKKHLEKDKNSLERKRNPEVKNPLKIS